MIVTYVDTSALAKLLVEEDESEPLRLALSAIKTVSSVLAGVELAAVARRQHIPGGLALATSVLERVRLLPLTDTVLRSARSAADAPPLRALDLLHLLTARSARDALGATTLIAYDRDLLDAASVEGFAVSAPT